MGNIASAFPPEFQKAHLERQITAGTILLLQCDFTTPPKEKFLITAHWGDFPRFFLINSRISNYYLKRPNLAKQQIIIEPSAYSFLSHVSYIDCTQLTSLEKNYILEQLMNNPSRIKGVILPETQSAILKSVSEARTLSPAEKALCFQ